MADYFSSLDKLEEWKLHLDPLEELIATFVLNRTIRWRKEWEAIPWRHFLGGVSSRDGRVIAAPLPLSRSTLAVKTANLIELGLLSVREFPSPRPSEYRLNLSVSMPLSKPKRLQNFAKSEEEGKLREPKTKKPFNSPRIELTGSENRTDSVRESNRLKREGKRENQKEGTKPRLRRGSDLSTARELRKEIQKEGKEKRETLFSKRRLSQKDIRTVWQSEVAALFSETNPLALPISVVHALSAKQKVWNKEERNETFGQFIRWTLENWGTIIRVQLSWMTKSPPDPLRPDPWVIINQMNSIHRLFEQRQSQWVRTADRFDPENELHQRMAIGQSYEEATQAMKDREEAERTGERLRSLRDELRGIEKRMSYADPSERREAVRKAREALREANNRVEL